MATATATKSSRLSLAQTAYRTARDTGRKANPYSYADQRYSWLAYEIGIYFFDSHRTEPWDISGRGYLLTVNNIRFRITAKPDCISFEYE